MIDPGCSGIDRSTLEGLLKVLAVPEYNELFPDRFTLEIWTGEESHLFHVSRARGVLRPVVAEDSRKRLVSVTLADLEALIDGGTPADWLDSQASGVIRVDQG